MAQHIDIQLLHSVITKQQPLLLPLLDRLFLVPLTIEQRERLREAIATELSETGLDDEDEPNDRGMRLEELISYLGRL